MKTDYSKLPAETPYDIFRNSDFAKIVDDKLLALVIKGEKKARIVFRQVADTPDAVSFSCFDFSTNEICKGTPEAGKYLLTRKAYEDFAKGFSNSENVKRDLKKVDEFLYDVKAGLRRIGA